MQMSARYKIILITTELKAFAAISVDYDRQYWCVCVHVRRPLVKANTIAAVVSAI